MATPLIVPRADSEGGLGSATKYWASAYIDTITTAGNVNIKQTDDSGFDGGLIIERSSNTQKLVIGIDGGAVNFNSPDSLTYKFRANGTEKAKITGDGNATFAGTLAVNGISTFTPGNISFDLSGQATGTTVIGNNSGSAAAPTVGGKTTATNGAGLQIISGSNNTNNGPDMEFSAREHDNSDFSTITTPAFQFKRHTTPLVSILRNGKFGIGTATPAFPLDIVGFANSNSGFIATDGTIDNRISWASGNVGFFGTISNHPIAFYTNSAERVRILADGKIGIGTTTPQKALEISAATTAGGGVLRLSGTGNGSQNDQVGAIEFFTGDTTDNSPGVFAKIRGVGHASGGEGSLQFVVDMPSEGADASTIAMHINPDGKIGVGTIAPSSLLHLHQTGSGTNTTIITEDDARKLLIGRDSIKCTDLSGNVANLNIQQDGGDVAFGGDVTLSSASSPAVAVTDTTNTVTAKLYSQNSDSHIGTTTNHPLIIDTNNTAAITIDTSQNATFAGNITFGDGHIIGDDGDDNLSIASSAGENIILDSAADIMLDADGGDWFFRDGGSNIVQLAVGSGSSPTFSASQLNADFVFKGNDGGQSVTALTLDMSEVGAATFSSTVAATSYNGVPLFTDVPNQSMYTHDVSATDVNAANNSAYGFLALSSVTQGDNNVAMGYLAGRLIDTGERNVTIGSHAGDALRGGGYNVAIGHGALSAEDGHGSTTAIGYKALNVQDAGAESYNVAVGYQAGLSVSTGVQNTIVGGSAGDAITTGAHNVAVGYDTLSAIDSGTRNTAVGYKALKTLTLGGIGENTALGYQAALVMETGSQNTALGANALTTNVDGDHNTAVGSEALKSFEADTDGHGNNTAVGSAAMRDATTGQNNTAVGVFAMGDGVVTGDENVAVGKGSMLNVTSTEYSTAIGMNSMGAGATSGNYNTAVGHNSGRDLTTGTENTLLGTNCALSISTGSHNVAVGMQTMQNNTVGNRNTAIGTYALFTNVDSSQNVAVGFEALRILEPASASNGLNVAVGYQAGKAMTTGTNNTVIGGEAGDSLTTGIQNVALGYAALSGENTGSKSVGIGAFALRVQDFNGDAYNVAVGHDAAKAVTSGVQNTALGARTLQANTVGADNVAIGYQALFTNVDGSRSIAIGTNALLAQEPASAVEMHNVAIGYNAGTSVTVATANTIIGGLAGDALTSGSANTAIGKDSLSACIDGDFNTAVGFEALEDYDDGDGNGHNTAIGSQSQRNATTGEFNTSLGSLSIGTGITTGDNNIAIGYQSGNALTSGASNVLIGRDAGDALTSGANNVAIGSEALSTQVIHGQNVAVGFRALKTQNVSGHGNNTAVGMQAGLSVTTGTENVFVGSAAGDGLTTGVKNVAVGAGALSAANAGNNNTAVGYQALAVAGDASNAGVSRDNTAIGFQAGLDLSTAVNTALMGAKAGAALTTGTNCTMIGYAAGFATEAGGNNTFIGAAAGLANEGGGNNIAIGQGADFGSANYSNAIAIGTGLTQNLGSNTVEIGNATMTKFKTNGAMTNRAYTGTAEGAGIDASDAVSISVGEYNSEIITNIFVDLGAGSIISTTTDGGILGNSGEEAPFITKITKAVNGVVYRGELICLEAPNASAAVDIDLSANSSGTLVAGADGNATILINSGGAHTVGRMVASTFAVTDNHFLYLTQSGTTNGTYGAGKLLIKLYGAKDTGL